MSEKTKVLGDIHLKTIELLDTELKKKTINNIEHNFLKLVILKNYLFILFM